MNADLLRERGIPFAFITGYGLSGLDPAYCDVPTLQKPFRLRELDALFLSILNGRDRAS